MKLLMIVNGTSITGLVERLAEITRKLAAVKETKPPINLTYKKYDVAVVDDCIAPPVDGFIDSILSPEVVGFATEVSGTDMNWWVD